MSFHGTIITTNSTCVVFILREYSYLILNQNHEVQAISTRLTPIYPLFMLHTRNSKTRSKPIKECSNIQHYMDKIELKTSKRLYKKVTNGMFSSLRQHARIG